MAKAGRPTTDFVNLNELPARSRTCELCENQFRNLELNGEPRYAVYPVRLLCGHIFCYDCARMWISHMKCPECDARFRDHAMTLEAIDEQIRQYKQYQVACFNGQLQAGMIRAPPGYPTFAGQQAGPSKWWHEDDTAKTTVCKPKSTSSGGLSAPSKLQSCCKWLPVAVLTQIVRTVRPLRQRNPSRLPKSTALGIANKVSGTNYSREDFPTLKLKYERKPRS